MNVREGTFSRHVSLIKRGNFSRGILKGKVIRPLLEDSAVKDSLFEVRKKHRRASLS